MGTGTGAIEVVEATMLIKWTNTLRYMLTICCMSGFVACGSLANCFNSGFAPVACGGGYGARDFSALPPPTAPSAEGRWTGTTPAGRIVRALVLEDGSYWLFYTARDNPNVLAGLVQGTGTSHLGFFGSSDARDFNFEGAGVHAATMRGSYMQKRSFNGTIAYFIGNTSSFTSTYDADYEIALDMNLVAGTYSGRRADNHTVSVTLRAAGTISGSSIDGCTFGGSFSPRAKGHVFTVALTFGGGTCSEGTETISGVAFYDASTQRLYSAALNNAKTDGVIFIGTKR